MLCKDALGAYNPLAPCGKYAIFDRKDCVLVFLVLSLPKIGFTSEKRLSELDALRSFSSTIKTPGCNVRLKRQNQPEKAGGLVPNMPHCAKHQKTDNLIKPILFYV